MSSADSPRTGSWLGRLASTVYPGLDERIWNRQRSRVVDGLLTAGGYEERLKDVPANGSNPGGVHIVVVPMEGPEHANYRAAGGNFFYEIGQAAREYAGADRVSVFCVEPGESVPDWQERLVRYLVDSGATHVIAQVEHDPLMGPGWHWDVLWSVLEPRWGGVFLGVMFDSSFRWLTIQTRRLARASDRFLLVDICMPMDGSMRRGRPEVGPVNMPVSNESLAVIDGHLGTLPKIHDVSFIGALYPYRVELIETLKSAGLRVAVNPHRIDAPHDLEGSRANQPTYVDYMIALAQSHMTINFSQSSAGPFQQLKTRVLEASAMGCLVLTDDVDRTERFWIKGEEYDHFATPGDLPALVKAWLADPERLAEGQRRARERARAINVTSFWGGIDEGLARRGLPPIVP